MLANSIIEENAKHPILLLYNNNHVHLLMKDIHKKALHAGPQGLLAIVRQSFWPFRGRQLMTKIVKECYRCFKAGPRTIHQLMGNLPKVRVIRTRHVSKCWNGF